MHRITVFTLRNRREAYNPNYNDAAKLVKSTLTIESIECIYYTSS